MGLFFMELYKILRRRMLWGGLAAILILMGLWFGMTVLDTNTVVDGVRYTGTEAIRKDREIVQQWEGALTMEKLYDIIETYGYAVNEGTEQYSPRTGNWVSRFATDLLTDYNRREDHSAAALLSDEELENLTWRLDTYKPYFSYLDEVDFFYEMIWTVNILLLFLIMIGFAPIFTEEYQCKTAPVLLTTVYGKKETLLAKLLAALTVAEGMYLLANGILYFVFFAVYGTDGLKADAMLVNVGGLKYWNCSVRQVYLISFFWGAAGFAVMMVTTLLFSAACRHSFAALAQAALFLVGGYVMRSVLLSYLPFRIVRRIILTLSDYNPLILLLVPDKGFLSVGWRIVLLAAGIAGSIFVMQKKWNSCEG